MLNTGNARSVLVFPKDKVVFKTKAFPDGIYEPYCKDRVSLLDRIEIKDVERRLISVLKANLSGHNLSLMKKF